MSQQLVSLSDFRPSRRHDELPWTHARIEEADELGTGGSGDGVWSEVEVFELDPLDDDPTVPCARSFTTALAGVLPEGWLRIVFLDRSDEDNVLEDEPSPVSWASQPQFRPTARQVAQILMARTYTDGGGEQREFGPDTMVTLDQVEDDLIPAACRDVSLAIGRVPGDLLEVARRVAALRVGAEIERSKLPEQSEDRVSIYQTLRLTYEAELVVLGRSIELWLLRERGIL